MVAGSSIEAVVTEVGVVEVLNGVDVGIDRGGLIEGIKVEVGIFAGGTDVVVTKDLMSVDGVGLIEDENNGNTVVDEVTTGSCELETAITRKKGNGIMSKY